MPNCLLWSGLGKRHATWCGAGIELCQRVRLLNRNFSVLCSCNILCWNQGNTGQEKLQAKRRPIQQHMRSMPSAHLWGKTVGERMEEWVNGVGRGCPLEWREIVCFLKWIPGGINGDARPKKLLIKKFSMIPTNKHRPTMILTSMTGLHVKRENIEIWCIK